LEVGHSCKWSEIWDKIIESVSKDCFWCLSLGISTTYEGLLSFLCGTGSLLNGMLQHPKSRIGLIGCCSRTLGFKPCRRIIGDAFQGTFMYRCVRIYIQRAAWKILRSDFHMQSPMALKTTTKFACPLSKLRLTRLPVLKIASCWSWHFSGRPESHKHPWNFLPVDARNWLLWQSCLGEWAQGQGWSS